MRLLLKRLFALFLITTAVVTASAGVAQASSRATHYATHKLAWYPHANMPTICLPAKEIVLVHQYYDWGISFGGSSWKTNGGPMELPAGTYYWGVCIDPQDGNYRINSSIDPAAAGPTRHTYGIANMMRPPDRDVTWGSYLEFWVDD